MVNAIVLLNIENAKSRLSPYFEIEDRRNLVLLMLLHVLNVLDDIPVTILPKSSSCKKSSYDEEGDINTGILRLMGEIDDDILVLPCDLPSLRREDVLKLMGNYRTLSIAPSQNNGTGALFIPKGIDFIPKFGKDSINEHKREAEEGNMPLRIFESDGFRDIDTIEDIKWFIGTEVSNSVKSFILALDPKAVF